MSEPSSSGSHPESLTNTPTTPFAQAKEPAAATISSERYGRYLILRLLARGGLGDVFVGRDDELGRDVALKRIQQRFAHNPECQRRFLQEASVTARLEHPGVVPVHGLVCDESGQPCYAMRLIEGESLKDAVLRFHESLQLNGDTSASRLAFRHLLQQFISVCQTIGYAHSRGVIHRDLKPPNIMLGPFGETLVVDWGLAKEALSTDRNSGVSASLLNRPIAATPAATSGTVNVDALTPAPGDSGTEQGAVLGTPAYMAPEQALGRWEEVGPASDIYSLGATLYFILTGRPPFDGPAVDILPFVQIGDFRPPRLHRPATPRALEAICLKAMAVQIPDRYPTAQALADDLEHWLADEPVSVGGEPWTIRAGRWLRRHRTLAASLAVGVLVAVISLGALSGIVTAKNADLAKANEEVVENFHKATELAAVVAAQNRDLARAKDQAEQNFQKAKQAVDTYLNLVTQDAVLKNNPNLDNLRRALLNAAQPFYQWLSEQQSGRADVEMERASALGRLGSMHRTMGKFAEALADFERQIEILTALAKADGAATELRRLLADSHTNRGSTLQDVHRLKEAEAEFRKALALYEPLAAASPKDAKLRSGLAGVHLNLGTALVYQNQTKDAEAEYRAGLAIEEKLAAEFPDVPDYRKDLAAAHNDLGALQFRLNRLAEAETALRRTAELRRQMVADLPDNPQIAEEAADIQFNLGRLFMTQARWQEATSAFTSAIDALQRLNSAYPAVLSYRRELANNRTSLGNVLMSQGRLKQAEEEHREAIALLEKLAAELPAIADYRLGLAGERLNLGWILVQLGRAADGEAEYRRALPLLEKLAADYPAISEFRHNLAGCHTNLGQLLDAQSRFDEAAAAYRQALVIRRKLVEEAPGIGDYRQELARVHMMLGTTLRNAHQQKDAVPELREAIAMLEALTAAAPTVAENRANLAAAVAHLGLVLSELGQTEDGEAHLRRATAAWEKLVVESPTVPSNRYELAKCRAWLAGLLAGLGRSAEATVAADAAIGIKDLDLDTLLSIAGILARRAAVVRDADLAESFKERAVALLRRAVEQGFKDRQRLEKETDWNALRQREDFAKLLEQLKN